MRFNEAIPSFDKHLAAFGRSGKTRYGYLRDVARVQMFLESKYNLPIAVEDVRASHVEEFIRYISEVKQMKPTSVNRILDALSSFFNYMQIHYALENNPARMVPRLSTDKKERSFMTQEQLRAFLASVGDPIISTVFYTLAYTGLRVSELTSLCVHNVRIPERRIHLIGKGKKKRIIPIHEVLQSRLNSYIHRELQTADDYDSFFHTHRTRYLSPSTVNRWIADRVTELGWNSKVTAHTFRHTFGYMYIDQGGNVVELQKIMGHGSLTVTSIYTHTTHERLSSGVGRLPEF